MKSETTGHLCANYALFIILWHFRPDKLIYQQNKNLKYTNIVNIRRTRYSGRLRTSRLRFWVSGHSYMRERESNHPTNVVYSKGERDGGSYRSACVTENAWARWRHAAPANHHFRKRRHELAKCWNIFMKSFSLVLCRFWKVSMKFTSLTM